jgi:hypothetical protein
MRIPIFVGTRIIEMADLCRAAVIARAPNAEVVRAHKTGAVVRINLTAVVNDSTRPKKSAREDSRRLHYRESLEPAPIVTLKIINSDGSVRRWDDADGFNPCRFNPDTLPVGRFVA